MFQALFIVCVLGVLNIYETFYFLLNGETKFGYSLWIIWLLWDVSFIILIVYYFMRRYLQRKYTAVAMTGQIFKLRSNVFYNSAWLIIFVRSNIPFMVDFSASVENFGIGGNSCSWCSSKNLMDAIVHLVFLLLFVLSLSWNSLSPNVLSAIISLKSTIVRSRRSLIFLWEE